MKKKKWLLDNKLVEQVGYELELTDKGKLVIENMMSDLNQWWNGFLIGFNILNKHANQN